MQKFSKSIDKNKKCFTRFVSTLLIYMRLLFAHILISNYLLKKRKNLAVEKNIVLDKIFKNIKPIPAEKAEE